LVLNEVLAEYTNPGNASFPNNFWAELHNPRQTSAVTTVQQLDNAPIVMSMPAAPAGQLTMQDGTVLSNPNQTNTYAPYQIVIAPKLYPATYNDNILGTPDAPRNGDSGSTPLFGTVDADFT